MSAEKKPDELKAFEAALAGLVPRTDRLDRDRLMFLAGQQSVMATTGTPPSAERLVGRVGGDEGKKRPAAWPMAFAGMSVVAATLFVMLILRPGQSDNKSIAKTSAPHSIPVAESKETTAIADSSDFDEQPRKARTYFDLAFFSGMDNRKVSEAESPYSNAALLRQILAKGVDSWKPTETGSYDVKPISTRPITNRELMNQLLDQAGAGPS
jgi:hypothetical protein